MNIWVPQIMDSSKVSCRDSNMINVFTILLFLLVLYIQPTADIALAQWR